MPHPALRVRDKLALWFCLVTLVSTSLLFVMVSGLALRTLTHEFGAKLAAIAASGALLVDGDAFATLTDPKQMESQAYQRIQAELRRLRAANRGVRFRYLYTMAPTEKPGIWRYVVDSEQAEAEEFSALGDTEDFSEGDVIVDAYERGEPAVDEDVKEYPGWGALLTAAAPIRNRAGKVVGVVGVDAPAVAVMQAQQSLLRSGLIGLALGLAGATALGFGVAWGLTRPLAALVRATEAVAGGDLEYRVDLTSRDEFGALGGAFNQMTKGLRQRELYRQQFERYVSRQIAEKILGEPDRDFWHGERRRATILFCDIRGFTAMAEMLPPEEVVHLLNDYLRVMIDVVFEFDGTVDKFIGDAIMGVFGAPVSLGNDEERAVRAALAMRDAVERMSDEAEARGRPEFRVSIGINTGEVVVGNIGSERRLEYAAIGDHVNLAARIEVLTREYDRTILISENTYQFVRENFDCVYVAEAAVRGRTQPVKLYEVLGEKRPA